MANKKTTSGGNGFKDFSFSNLKVKWNAVRVKTQETNSCKRLQEIDEIVKYKAC